MQLLVGQPFGTIIGVVDLVDVHTECRLLNSSMPTCSPWAEPHAYHLEFAHPRALATPIPYTGALGLRELEEKVVGQIRHQVCLGEHETRCCSPCHHHREGLHVGCVLR